MIFAKVVATESHSQLKLKEVCCDLVSIAFKTGRSLIEIESQLQSSVALRLRLNCNTMCHLPIATETQLQLGFGKPTDILDRYFGAIFWSDWFTKK